MFSPYCHRVHLFSTGCYCNSLSFFGTSGGPHLSFDDQTPRAPRSLAFSLSHLSRRATPTEHARLPWRRCVLLCTSRTSWGVWARSLLVGSQDKSTFSDGVKRTATMITYVRTSTSSRPFGPKTLTTIPHPFESSDPLSNRMMFRWGLNSWPLSKSPRLCRN